MKDAIKWNSAWPVLCIKSQFILASPASILTIFKKNLMLVNTLTLWNHNTNNFEYPFNLFFHPQLQVFLFLFWKHLFLIPLTSILCP